MTASMLPTPNCTAGCGSTQRVAHVDCKRPNKLFALVGGQWLVGGGSCSWPIQERREQARHYPHPRPQPRLRAFPAALASRPSGSASLGAKGSSPSQYGQQGSGACASNQSSPHLERRAGDGVWEDLEHLLVVAAPGQGVGRACGWTQRGAGTTGAGGRRRPQQPRGSSSLPPLQKRRQRTGAAKGCPA